MDLINFRKKIKPKVDEAIWQYLIDHSTVERNGYYKIHFHVYNLEDFWKRVHARYTGDFQRYDKLERQHKMSEIAFHKFRKSAAKMAKTCDKIDKQGTLKEKVMLYLYRKARDYLKKK